jgi:hypothetical protein
MRRAIFGYFVATTIALAIAQSPLFAVDPISDSSTIENAIDNFITAELERAKRQPASQAAGETLVRRLTLDLVGRVPAPIETKQFIETDDPAKREKLVDQLISSPEFVDYMTDRFDVMLMAETKASLRDYLKVAFQENRSWDQVFRDLLVPNQEDENQKAAREFVRRRANDPDKLTVDVSSLFFGVNVSCSKCHDHPEVDDWSQDHFYGMKSFFNRTFENGDFFAEREYGLVKYTTTAGEERDAKLMFLTGKILDEPEYKEPTKDEQKKDDERFKKLAEKKQPPPAPKYSRRARLIEIALQNDQNQFFARSIVNRLWYQFYGHGLVMPLDQMHSENPPSHPALLDWLARDLVAHKYDLRRLVRGMVLSQTYSRSSLWESADPPSKSMFAVAIPRALTPLQYARSLRLATNDPQSFEGIASSEELQKRIMSSASAGNTSNFQQPNEDFQIAVQESLYFSNSAEVQQSYLNSGLFNRLKGMTDRNEIVKTAVWSIFTRPPTAEETDILSKYLAVREDRHEEACRQLIWALLTSTEFRFNY